MTLNSSTSKIGFLLHMFLLFSSTLSTSLNTSELEVFGVFIEEHKAVCPVYGTCGVGLPFDIPLSCCGYCSCEPDCEKFGNCCPEYYQSFSEGMNLVARNK